MSELWLLIAIACVFFTVILVGFALDATATDKKRTVRLLESQVSGSSTIAQSANLRERQMARSFGDRILIPFVGGAGRLAKRITPLDARDRVAKKLLLAGSPPGWDAERVIAFKVIGAAAGLFGGLILTKGPLNLGGLAMIVSVGLLSVAGFLLPDSTLARQVQERQHEVLSTLSDTLDLLTISVEA
jgi:tight adherence protein C